MDGINILPDLKYCNKVTPIKIVCYLQRNTHLVFQNAKQNPEIDPQKHSRMIFHKDMKAIQ